MIENPRAPADSPCELVHAVCEKLQSLQMNECKKCPRTCQTEGYGECYNGCWLIAEEVIETVRSNDPPVLSARPNEAEICGRCGKPRSELCGDDFVPMQKNGADAPRGQAVACWIDGADIGFLSDGLKSSAHVYPHQALPCCVPLYASPVGEADGVREKLLAFARDALEDFWEGDGTMQEMGEKHGLLIPTVVNEPCGEGCTCQEYGADFPTDCYKFAPFLRKEPQP